MATHPLLNAAFASLQRGDAHQALAALHEVLAAEPNNATAHLYQGHALYRLNRKAEALQHFERAATLQPQFADAFYHKGALEAELERVRDAEVSFRRTLVLKPDYAAVYGNLGALYVGEGRTAEALDAFSTLIKHQPHDARAYFNRGTVLLTLAREDEALTDFERSATLKADYAPPHAALMRLYADRNRFDAALRHADCAARLLPAEADIHLARGDVLRSLGRFADAIHSYDIAIKLRSDHGPSYVVRGDAYTSLKQLDKAAADYVRAAELAPYAHFATGYAVQALALMCDWANIDALMPVLREGLQQGSEASTPFSLLACDVSAQDQRRCAEIMSRKIMTGVKSATPLPRHNVNSKIRIGYFSPDFGAHAVSYLMAGVFEDHDRGAFDVIGFSYGPASNDPMYGRVKGAFEQFADIGAMSDHDAAAHAQQMQIDIAIDLAGYTGRGRPGIFARRAALVQVNFLGFAGTMGAPFMDYIVVDDVVAPDASDFTEKLVYLPGTFLPSDPKRPRPDASRRDFGFADEAFVFCAFNNAYKINRATFTSWLNILRRVPEGVLWLTGSNTWQIDNLKRFAQNEGIAPTRLVFAGHVPSYADHLARYRAADLFLDALPYNAHTTASDALWMGVPVLTCTGHTFAGRVAASLLHTLGMPEMVAPDRQSFEDLAVTLAQDRARLHELRERTMDGARTSAVFNTPRFTRRLERAFHMMVDRSRRGDAPTHLHVTE